MATPNIDHHPRKTTPGLPRGLTPRQRASVAQAVRELQCIAKIAQSVQSEAATDSKLGSLMHLAAVSASNTASELSERFGLQNGRGQPGVE